MLCKLTANSPQLGDIINYVTCTINNSIIPLIFTLAFAMFIWGVVQYVINGDEEVKKEKGKQFMIWGILGLVVMFGVWGLVAIVGNTFGLNTSIVPHVTPPGSSNSSGFNSAGFPYSPTEDCDGSSENPC